MRARAASTTAKVASVTSVPMPSPANMAISNWSFDMDFPYKLFL
jgi:hypothetical protein